MNVPSSLTHAICASESVKKISLTSLAYPSTFLPSSMHLCVCHLVNGGKCKTCIICPNLIVDKDFILYINQVKVTILEGFFFFFFLRRGRNKYIPHGDIPRRNLLAPWLLNWLFLVI